MISIKAQIASAVRYANALYLRLPDDESRDRFAALWLDLEREVDIAEAAGNLSTIESLIGEWRQTATDQFRKLTAGPTGRADQ